MTTIQKQYIAIDLSTGEKLGEAQSKPMLEAEYDTGDVRVIAVPKPHISLVV